MEYHIQITIHPVVKKELSEENIDTGFANLSIISQGNGLSKNEAIQTAHILKDELNNHFSERSLNSYWQEK